MAPSEHFLPTATGVPGRFTWEPSPLLFIPAGTLQGGAALGAAAEAMSQVTGRPLVWATGQYLSFAALGGEITFDVVVEVSGHNTTQARCIVSKSGSEILTVHGALGSRQMEHSGVWARMPNVPHPDDCPEYDFFPRGNGDIGDFTDVRLARGRQFADLDGTRTDGNFVVWLRVGAGVHQTSVAELTFVGDFMPLGFANVLGQPYTGRSVDNTIRMGQLVPTEWIMVSVHVNQIVHGHGHGHANLWAQDGTLLGQVSQTAGMHLRTHVTERGVPRNAV
ncbi:MAG: thioesterase family protein [Actinomycetota bacterium]|nr:thioesterase family protein [Actinomycetota bacterium]